MIEAQRKLVEVLVNFRAGFAHAKPALKLGGNHDWMVTRRFRLRRKQSMNVDYQ